MRTRGIPLALALGLLAAAARADAPAGRVGFHESARVGVGHAPVAIAVGDLDRDRTPDVVLASDDTTVISLLGDGAGGVRAASVRTLAPDLVGVALADVNHDGLLDAAVSASSSGTVFILDGAGDGTFVAGPEMRGPWTPGALAFDFESYNDQGPDLAVADLFFQQVAYMVNLGTGSFLSPQQYVGFVDPIAIAFGEVDGDNVPDLAVADQASRVVTVLDGFGVAPLEHRWDVALAGRPVALAVGDLDGDGHSDLVVTTRAPNAIEVLRGGADGAVRAAHTYAAGPEPGAIAIADFDRDGRPDVAVADRAGRVIDVWLGDGQGALVHATSVATGNAPVALAVADMNGDGWPDLVCANHDDGTVQVFLNTTSPGVGAFHLFAPSPNPTPSGCEISFVLSTTTAVDVEIHDLTGRLVRRLIHRPLETGVQHVAWDGRTDAGDAARSGLYFVRVRAGGHDATARIVLER